MEQNKEYNVVKAVIGKLEQQRTSIEQGQVCYPPSLSLLLLFLSLFSHELMQPEGLEYCKEGGGGPL